MPRVCNWRAAFMVLIVCTSGDHVFAGGWDRFDQGVDLLFDPGKQVVDVRLYDLIPNRKFNTVNGVPETVNTGTNIFRPSLNTKFTPFENAACLAAFRRPFGLDNDYGSTWSQASIVVSRSLQVDELGLTCSYRVPAGGGYVRPIAGLTEDFATYHEEALRQLPNGSFIRPALDVEASAPGWRAGLGYEVPTKALRASIMYYSTIDLFARGTLRQLPLGGNAFLDAVPVRAGASIPRAVEAIVQAAIAADWLNTVSVRWVNWSTLTSVPVILTANSGPLQAGRTLSSLNAFFLDGLTISDTITHRWSDNLALSLNLGWDRGVSTGWTDNPDGWNVFSFATYKISDHVDLTGGLGVIIVMPGEIDKRAQGGGFNATAGTGSIVFTHLGVRSRF